MTTQTRTRILSLPSVKTDHLPYLKIPLQLTRIKKHKMVTAPTVLPTLRHPLEQSKYDSIILHKHPYVYVTPSHEQQQQFNFETCIFLLRQMILNAFHTNQKSNLLLQKLFYLYYTTPYSRIFKTQKELDDFL
mmetsp:Transcript_27537/g.41210  ORF Transcript_27537/g.41210 Transcript_27537/m.41210 type:complete len:133 (-) Transcript_27537:777-1175(-)